MVTSLPVTYDQGAWATRIVNTQPSQWFSDSAKLPGGGLYSLAYALAGLFTLSQQGALFAYDAAYINSAVDGYLDMAAADYYGTGIIRNPGESDSSFSTRIRAGLLTPVATLQAVSSAVQVYSGITPIIIQPWDVSSTGRYDASFFDVPDGHKMGLRYTPSTPFECLVITQFTGGVPLNGSPVHTFDDDGFMDSYTMMYADLSIASGGVSALLQTIQHVAPVGVALWVQVSYNPVL